MALLATVSATDSRHYLILSTLGNISLFPLLFESGETNVKVCLALWHFLVTLVALKQRKRNQQKSLGLLDKLYLFLAIPMFITTEAMPFVPSLAAYTFLPLMIYSMYCSVGIFASYVIMYRNFITVSPRA